MRCRQLPDWGLRQRRRLLCVSGVHRVLFVAGLEGTGHHFFDFVGHRLRYLSEPTELLPNFANEAYNDLQLCVLRRADRIPIVDL